MANDLEQAINDAAQAAVRAGAERLAERFEARTRRDHIQTGRLAGSFDVDEDAAEQTAKTFTDVIYAKTLEARFGYLKDETQQSIPDLAQVMTEAAEAELGAALQS